MNDDADRSVSRGLAVVLLGALVWVFALRFNLIRLTNINWDEFYFLSKVHLAARGELSGRLLTFHTHLFGWVLRIEDNEALQVLIVRRVMWAVSIVGAVVAAFVGWRLLKSLPAALFGVLAGASVSVVLQHGSAARFDPLVVFGFLVACAALLVRRRGAVVVAGAAIAFSLLISIKAVFYGPTLLVFVWARYADLRGVDAARARADFFAVVAAVVGFTIVGFGLHVLSLADSAVDVGGGVAGSGAGSSSLSQIVAKVFGDRFAVPSHLMLTLRWDIVFWLTVLAGMCLTAGRIEAGDSEERRNMLRMLALVLPLFSVVIYRNAYTYYYVCIVPSAALLTGLVVKRLEVARRPVAVVLVTLGLTTTLLTGVWNWMKQNAKNRVRNQIAVVDAVHTVFPQPVPYIDRCSMIGSFEHVGPFMSTWTLSEYRARKQPIFVKAVSAAKPLFVIANVDGLELDRELNDVRRQMRLLPEDFALLRRGYIQWWGPLWIAGRRVDVAAGKAANFDAVVAAEYVVEGIVEGVTVDGNAVAAGSAVHLDPGVHVVVSPVAGTVTVRAAAAQQPPKTTPPTKLFYSLAFET